MVVFTDELVNGEECAQATALLKSKEGAVSENHLPDVSPQAFQTQSVLKSPRGTSMPHIIELVIETCHDARLYFLLVGLEAKFVKGFASVGQCVSHRGFAHTKYHLVVNENKMVGAHRFFLSVSSGEDGRQSVIFHDVRSRGS